MNCQRHELLCIQTNLRSQIPETLGEQADVVFLWKANIGQVRDIIFRPNQYELLTVVASEVASP